MNLKLFLLNGYKPKSASDEATHVFSALYNLAPIRLPFLKEWEGPRDTLKPLVSNDVNIQSLGIGRGKFARALDARDRRVLIIPITLGFVAVREVQGSAEQFKSWASPKAQGLEGVARTNVNLALVLSFITWNNWTPVLESHIS